MDVIMTSQKIPKCYILQKENPVSTHLEGVLA